MGNINIIVAASTNMVIGKDNDLPWNIPTDLKNFKKITSGHPVIMGRKCWESIPEKFRPLPNRKNIVITRNKDYKVDGALVGHDLLEVLNDSIYNHDDVFVIGGAQIYKEAFNYANKLYLTQIYDTFDGDTFLEGLNPEDWTFESGSKMIEENGINFRFEIYNRRNNGNFKTNNK